MVYRAYRAARFNAYSSVNDEAVKIAAAVNKSIRLDRLESIPAEYCVMNVVVLSTVKRQRPIYIML